MPPDVLVSTGLQYGGNIIDMASQNYRDKRNHRWDVQAATTAYDRQRQLLADQRAYESPAAQMRRYIEAGLNPNLIYGQQQGSIAPPTVPQASNSVGTTHTSFGDVNLLQQKLLDAQIKNLGSKDDLNRAEAWKIYKITPVQFEQIQNDADLIRQKIESGSYVAAVEKFKAESFNDNRFFTIEDENGHLITDDLKSLIIGNEFKKLYSSDLDYQLAIKTFMNKVGLSDFDLEYASLTNQDLKAFVDVCARIYEAQAKQSDYLGAIADLNKEFFDDLGASSDVVKLVYGFLSLIIGGVSNFTPKISKRTVNQNIHSNKYD